MRVRFYVCPDPRPPVVSHTRWSLLSLTYTAHVLHARVFIDPRTTISFCDKKHCHLNFAFAYTWRYQSRCSRGSQSRRLGKPKRKLGGANSDRALCECILISSLVKGTSRNRLRDKWRITLGCDETKRPVSYPLCAPFLRI